VTRINISLMTLGDPGTLSGGYLYHRRLAEAGPRHDARISFVSFPERPFPFPSLYGPRALRLATGADAVVVDSIVAAYTVPWLKALRVPIVGMLHQPPGGIDHGPIRARVQRVLDVRAYRRAVRLLVASQTLADDMRAAGFRQEDIELVAPGRDVAVPKRNPGDLRKGRKVSVLCVANWVERKGILPLLDALGGLPKSTATLHLVGNDRADRAYARRVQDRLAHPELAGRVVVHGPLSKEEVAAMYDAADMFALPSYREPYGTVYGEAMAAGLPVVGWRAGNLPYLADDGREGFLVAADDVGGLADALARLAEDDALRLRMGDAARRKAQVFPTWDDTAARFFKAVRDVVRSGS
jgi:glycosyltransferase involved in cell wall biosynthesis